MAKAITEWDQIVGHKNLTNLLRRKVELDNVQNICLFYGAAGIGKTVIAKLLAVDVATRLETSSDRKASYTNSVIVEGKDTDSIKLFNMSEIQDKEENVQRVKNELRLGFTSTGRKVLILDEAHNMSKYAQDSILVDLEHLDDNVYVFICTTEIGKFQEALQSRASKGKFYLKTPAEPQLRKLIRDEIAYRQLQFTFPTEMVVSLILDYSEGRPRDAYNLLESFNEGSMVTDNELEVYVNLYAIEEVLQLFKYLYESMVMGIDYINSLRIDDSFVPALVEICKVAMGGTSKRVTPKTQNFIRGFMEGRDSSNITQFTIEVSGLSSLIKRRIISAFMRAHVSAGSIEKPVKDYSHSYLAEDESTASKAAEASQLQTMNSRVNRVMTVEEAISNMETMEG